MAKAELRVFVASPGGLDDERDAIEKIANNLNANMSDRLSVNVVVRRFEQLAARAGRPQGQINPWIDDCDILIAVIHRRWGSPSGEGSQTGFSEEFGRAIERYEATGSPVVSLHFKKVDSESQADAGPQLEQVLQFRRRIETDHIALYKEFDSIDRLALNVQQLLFEQMQAASDAALPTDDDSTAGASESRATVSAEERPDAENSGIARVLETVAEVIRNGSSEHELEIDRLVLFSNSVARDPETVPVHLTNRLFRKRGVVRFSDWELNAWFRSYLSDHGRVGSPADRVTPFVSVVGRARLEEQLLDRATDILSSDLDHVKRGYLRLLSAFELRPEALWGPEGSAEMWSSLGETGLSVEVVEYWATVATIDDLSVATLLAQGEKQSARELGGALVALIDDGASNDAIVALDSKLLVRPAILERLPGNPWTSVSDSVLTDVASRTYLDQEARLPAIQEVARRGIWPKAVIEKLVKKDPLRALFVGSWESEARALLLTTADSATISLILEAVGDFKPADASQFLAELAGANSTFHAVFVQQAPDFLAAARFEEFFSLKRLDQERRREALRILSGTSAPLNRHMNGLRESGAEQSLLDFVAQKSVSIALLYLVEFEDSVPHAALAKLRALCADSSAAFRYELMPALERVAADRDIPILLDYAAIRWRDAPQRLAKLLQRATLARLDSLLDSEIAEYAIAALRELSRRGRLPSQRKRRSLLRHKDPSMRMAALESIRSDLTDPASFIDTYIEDGPAYFYNVVCELDRVGAGVPI